MFIYCDMWFVLLIGFVKVYDECRKRKASGDRNNNDTRVKRPRNKSVLDSDESIASSSKGN